MKIFVCEIKLSKALLRKATRINKRLSYLRITMEELRQFHQAIKENDAEKVRHCIDNGISPDEPNWELNGWPGLLEAVYYGHKDVVEVLFDTIANPNAQNTLGETALHYAFHPKTFSKEIVELLLKNGTDVNIKEKLNGYTAVHLASKLVSSKMAKTSKEDLLYCLKMLCEKANVRISSSRKETPMHRLVSGSADCTEALQVFLENEFELDAQNDRGETCLMCAIDKGHINMSVMLIKAGGNVNIKDRHFQTALHHCVQKNQSCLVKMLLDSGCEINAMDLNGDSALHIAASKGLKDIVQVLISHSEVDVNVQNIRGSTPLLNAVESGFTKVVEVLLEAYNEAKCEKGILNALNKAEENFVRRWHPEIISLLREALKQKRDLWDEGETSL